MSDQEKPAPDPTFFDRADAHIHLSNSQLAGTGPGKVSGSRDVRYAAILKIDNLQGPVV